MRISFDEALETAGAGTFQRRLLGIFGLVWAADAMQVLAVGFTAGSIPTVAVNRLLLNNISVTGVGWGAYCLPRPGHIAGEWAAMEPHLRSGALKPVLGPTFPLDKAVDALQCLEARAATGKVVLTV